MNFTNIFIKKINGLDQNDLRQVERTLYLEMWISGLMEEKHSRSLYNDYLTVSRPHLECAIKRPRRI